MTRAGQFTRRRFLLQSATSGIAAAATSTSWTHARAAEGDSADEQQKFDEYIRKAMADWNAPGLAIAVIRDRKLLFARGYGVRQLGRGEKVTPDTLFPIASCTKSFTAAAIAKLVDQGKVCWDDPLTQHLPRLQLPQEPDGAKATIRHALSHRTGLPTANMLWRSGEFDGDEILRRVRLLKPVAAPGDKLIYNNVMYLAVGRIIEQVSGQRWSEFIRIEFFEPLGMKSSVEEGSQLAKFDNVAIPHSTLNGDVAVIERHCPDVIAPTGAIHSTAADMVRWLLLHLDRGRFAGRELLTAPRMDEMHTPIEPAADQVDVDPKVPKPPITRYGLGWFVNTHAGRDIVEHSGVQNGFVCWMALLPREGHGVVILSNHHQTGINFALRSWTLDRLLAQPDRDWSTVIREDYTNGWERLLREAKADYAAKRVANSAAPRPLSEYVGSYESRLYGTIRVTENQGRLELRLGKRFHGHLEHWQSDAFRVFFSNPLIVDWKVTFASEGDKIVSLYVQESPWAPHWYDDHDDLGHFHRQ